MSSSWLIYAFAFSSIYLPYLISSQQPYISNICPKSNNFSSVPGYACNGVNRTCPAYLIYRTQPSYNTLFSIASLFSVNVFQVSAINDNLSVNATFPNNTEVLVPVTCSCSGRFYQANTTHLVQAEENYYVIAHDIFEGLTTCNAIRLQKVSPNIVDIFPNEKLTIPVRCACPTKDQVSKGIRYLMSFVVQSGDAFGNIASKFHVDPGQILDANEKSEQDSIIQPLTTVLVPLQIPPNGSLLEYPPPLSPSSSLPPSPSSSPPSGSSNKKWVFFGVGIVVGGAFILVAGIIVLFIFLKMSRKKTDPIVSSQSFEAQEKALATQQDSESLEFLKNKSSLASLKVYSFKDLQEATENFSPGCLIKGSVYKGNLNGDQVAIKKMDGDVNKEISVLNKINHFNLIRLLGVCFNDGVWYLVYEYAANGPLSEWIYQDNPDHKTLSWVKRIQVASDVATGLNYLHSYTTPPHVHKDIKSSNVLLNGDFRAKIAKLGLSRSVRGYNGQFTLTKHIVGTKGYLAPEYLENGLVSPMLDVYSFGVLLLEMITGKDVASLYEGVKVNLLEVIAPVLSEGDVKPRLKAFVDPSLGENCPEDVAMSMIVLIDGCLRKDPGSRPSMDEIAQILSKTLTASLIWESTSVASTSSS